MTLVDTTLHKLTSLGGQIRCTKSTSNHLHLLYNRGKLPESNRETPSFAHVTVSLTSFFAAS